MPLGGMLAAPKVFEIEGGAIATRIAEDVFPVPPLVELTVTELLYVPAALTLTFTLKLQLPLAATVAPLRLTVLAPAAAVIVPPPHDPVRPLGDATVIPLGKMSVN